MSTEMRYKGAGLELAIVTVVATDGSMVYDRRAELYLTGAIPQLK